MKRSSLSAILTLTILLVSPFFTSTGAQTDRSGRGSTPIRPYTFASLPGVMEAWGAAPHGQLPQEQPTAPYLGQTPNWTATGKVSGDMFGAPLASAGDLNGDGYADLVVGARGFGASKGKAYVYYGSADGLSATAGWTVSGENDNDWYGFSVAKEGL